ncbi:FHA domain-containing protein [Thiohalophilus thiocyanatoxydans]|uniref:FHA domain-containing protein n=1 Tax=Thiohalophilus thiocyanatoxydans TaxID=381308 RepID=A0A4R8IX97_9GAMM|nr:FHA domain-containing protein [Thiohalophilus thiocyanatoxydans]TDY02389.1 FHA domain-containing protein [Thiohalophilus thiocyanatoxydans]
MSKLTLSFKGSMLRVYPVLKGSMLIGRDPDCTIHIDSLAVSPQHARIDTRDQTSVLLDLDSEGGTYVGQEKIAKHLLKDGDVIRVGKHTLAYKYEDDPHMASAEQPPGIEEVAPSQPAEPEVSHESRQGWLQILNGQNLGKTLSLNRSMTNLGKPGIATAVITRRNDGYFLSHLEGDHPPLVDNQPLGEHSHKLQDGNTIQIGNIKMQFFLD